jgi:FkbM family methyltransferase
MPRLLDTAARHLRALRQFPRLRDKALYVYGRILRRVSWPLPGRNAVAQVQLRGHLAPFHLRLGSTDWLVLEEIFFKDEYAFVQEFTKEANWILDLGSNVGYSLRYWQTLFPDAHMVAMEPDPKNYSLCARNICSAGLDKQIKLLQAGVGARLGQMNLVDSGYGEWAYRTEVIGEKKGQLVEILPLADVLERHAKGMTIDLLKCDIEGAERELFEDCRSWIQRIDAIVIELHTPYTLPELLTALERAGADFEVARVVGLKLCPIVLLRRAHSRGPI